jgi:hypothetical protein
VAVQPGDAHRTLLTVDLEGLVPGQVYVVLVHAGTRAAPSASLGVLGSVAGDADGHASLQTSLLTASAAGSTVELSLDFLEDGQHLIAVHATPGSLVAIGEIPSAAAP